MPSRSSSAAVDPGRRAGIGQEHDRRLEALGAVHRHDANLVAAVLHVALHLALGLAQVGEKAGAARAGSLRRRRAPDRGTRRSGRPLRARGGPACARARRRDREWPRRIRRAAHSRRARASASAFSAAVLKRAFASAASSSAYHSVPLRPSAISRRSSSSNPKSGLFSTVAERQIVLGQREEIAERRSDPAPRSAPSSATGRRRRRGCRAPSGPQPWAPRTGAACARGSGCRPARMGRASDASCSPDAIQPLIVSAMRSASRVPRRSRRSSRQAATRHPPARRHRASRSATSRSARRARVRWAAWRISAAVCGQARRARRHRRTRDRLRRKMGATRAERQHRAGRCRQGRVAPLRSVGEAAGPSARTCAAQRPGRNRSTASRRRRQKACGAPRAAPVPEKNSSASASMTSHCSGLVSCASSTRMWSSPPSSL